MEIVCFNLFQRGFFFIFLSPAVRFYYEIYHTKMFVLFFIETYFKKYFYQNDLKL